MRSWVVRTIGVVAVAACARHRSAAAQAPGPAPSRLAEARLTLPGTPRSLWNMVINALTDSSYRFSGGNYDQGISSFQSLREGRYIRVVMTPVGADSTRLVLTGRRYV